MYRLKKNLILAASLVALLSGQFVAYGSGEDYPEGERDNKRPKVNTMIKLKNFFTIRLWARAPVRNKPLFGRNNHDAKLKIVGFLDGVSAKQFALVCFEATQLVRERGRVKISKPLNLEPGVQVAMLHSTLKFL